MNDKKNTKEQLQNEKGAIQKANDELEQRIQDRTAELQQAAQQLEHEIEKRKRIEQTLIETKAQLEHLLAASPASIYRCKLEDNYRPTFVSENIKDQFDYEPQQFLDDPDFWAGHIHPEDAPGVFADIRKIYERDHLSLEYRFLHKDGTYRWMYDELKLTRDDDGNPVDIVGNWKDITARKQAEEALLQSEKKYRTLVEQSLQGIVIIQDSRIVFTNEAFAEIYGYTIEELYSLSAEKVLALIHPDDRKLVQGRLNDRLKGKPVPQHFEFRGIRRDGSECLLEIYANLIMYDGSSAVQGTILDISERKQVEDALKKSEGRYRMLVERMNEGLALIDENSIFTYANSKFLEMIGYPEDEIIGRQVSEFLDEANLSILKQQLLKRRKGSREIYEMFWTAKDGSQIGTLISPEPLFDDKGHFKGSFAVITDITELKQSERKLREREEECELRADELEEVNTALRVLLKRKDEDKTELEENVLLNVKELVEPYLEKLKISNLNDKQKSYLNILHANLNDIISPFANKLTSKYSKLTPKEILVANLVKHGKTTKDIGNLLNLSPLTIESHRKNIRIKLGIKKNRANLRTHLLFLP